MRLPRRARTRLDDIRNLKCFNDLHDRVVQGWSLGEIAKYVQDVKGELKEWTRDQLIDAIKHYRQTIPPGQIVGRRISNRLRDTAIKKIEKGLDELGEYERLYRLQMERIDIEVANERNIKKLLENTHNEIAEARKILHASAQLKMDLGLNHRNLGTVNVDAQLVEDVADKYGSEAIAKVAQNPESRHKVLSLAQQILGLSRHVDSGELTAEPDPDETYIEDTPVDEDDEAEGGGTP